jgi:lipopolysaccharide transport system ATP-binding protein
MTLSIRFDNVSKKFSMQQSRPRSWQERLAGMFNRKQETETEEKSFWVLKDISFEIQQGESFSFIGANGAGKSTLLKLLTHIIRPTRGTIELNGRISALLELGTGFHPDLTGRENIYLNGAILGITQSDIRRKIDEIIEFAELQRFIDVPVRNYSSGMYVRLGFAVAIYTEPEILIVDEVLAVGDAAFQRKCMEQIDWLRRRGVTIILVTHDMDAVQNMCKRAVWLERGKIRAMGEAEAVVRQYVWDSYEQHPITLPTSFDEDTDDAPEEEYKEPAKRWGTGEVSIEQVKFLDGSNQPRDFFTTGESMTLALHYQANQHIENPVFGIGIHHSDGTHVTGPNTKFTDYKIPYIEGEGVIYYKVPALPLLAGTYYVSVAVCDEKIEHMFDFHDQLHPFRVIPSEHEKYGLVTLHGNWSCQNGKREK